MVLEHQLKVEDDQNAALELDLVLQPELIGIIRRLQMMICF